MKLSHFDGAKLLLIAPQFFGYDLAIKAKLIEAGLRVDSFDERPGNGTFTKLALRLRMPGRGSVFAGYFAELMRATAKVSYDFVLFISPESWGGPQIKALRQQQPKAKFIFYNWDSFANKPSSRAIAPLFDTIATFDADDAATNPGTIFRPLFYLDRYRMPLAVSSRWDLLFVGSVHSDRYRTLAKLHCAAKAKGLRSNMYIFIQSPLLRLWREWQRQRSVDRTLPYQKERLDQAQVVKMIEESRVLVDIHHPRQTGLTIRTMEALGSRRKLITTNKNVRKYDFFDSENICIIDRERPEVSLEFCQRPYVEPPQIVCEQYSVEQWLLDLLAPQHKEAPFAPRQP